MGRRDFRFVKRRYRSEINKNKLAQPGPNPLVVVIDKMKPSYNIGKIFRTADAFGAAAVHLIGIPAFDPCTARGSLRYVPAVQHADFAAAHAMLVADGYTLVALDPEGDHTLPTMTLRERTALVVGHEEFGFSFDPAAYPEVQLASIPQVGHVHSLNAAVAASMAMYEWMRQRRWSQSPTGEL